MKGVYIVDISSNVSFVTCAESYEDACIIANTVVPVPCNIDQIYSYHYYPMMKNESNIKAELRVYIMVSKLMSSINLLSNQETLEEIAKHTYPPNFKRILSVSDISPSPKSDTQFNISI